MQSLLSRLIVIHGPGNSTVQRAVKAAGNYYTVRVKRSQKILWTTSVCLLVVTCVGVFAIWRSVTKDEVDHTPKPYQGCVDNHDEMIEELGGSQKAAMNGISSTLEGCNYSN